MKKKIVRLASIFFVIILSNNLVFGKVRETKLNQEEWKKLNTFFSNFSEVFLIPFEKGQITNKELIRFGVFHNLLNNYRLFQPYKSSYLKIAKKYVQVSIDKYFGIKKIIHETAGDAIYEKGNYLVPEADGEVYCFSQVTKLIDIGNSYFVAYLNIYYAGSGFTGDPNGNLKTWNEARDGDVPELSGKMKATIQKVNSNNSSRCILIDYLEDK
jgi:hypothetical protein